MQRTTLAASSELTRVTCWTAGRTGGCGGELSLTPGSPLTKATCPSKGGTASPLNSTDRRLPGQTVCSHTLQTGRPRLLCPQGWFLAGPSLELADGCLWLCPHVALCVESPGLGLRVSSLLTGTQACWAVTSADLLTP